MERDTEARSCRSRCPELLHGDSIMTVSIGSTTGSRFELSVPLEETVEGLKSRLSDKLRVPGDRLLLLHRDTRLNSGKLLDLGVADGSRLTLVPTVEAGLMSQSWRPEQSVLQALESLSDAQVSDFLSGRSPLTLALRVGDHMMFVQLQLEAQQSGGQPSISRGSNRTHSPCGSTGSNTHHHGLDILKTRPAPPSPQVHHAHSSQSPAPALPRLQAESGSERQRCKPGAVIESLVNHAPGVFSGTFSGTLHPNCQDSSGRPRRDISTILQILNDLLSATRHYQGSPPTLTHLRCPTPGPPASPCSPPASPTSDRQQLGRPHRPSGEHLRQTENRATRCKVEQLQLLLQQRRLRRKTRRDPRGPYHWTTDRRSARTHRNSSLSRGGSLDLDYEEPVWKADVASDMNAEFVAA